MTVPEIKLWTMLRDRNLVGAKFRRQHPMGPYSADFYCAEAEIVVELDGQMHDREHDAARDRWMKENGIRVMRFSVSAFERDMGWVVGEIGAAVRTALAAKSKAIGAEYLRRTSGSPMDVG